MLDLLLITLTDKTPEPEDVKAGWTALIIFLLLAVAVAVLGFSLVKQLRKAQSAKDAGVYGDEPVDRTAATSPEDLDRADPGPAGPVAQAGDEPTARPDDGVDHRS
jgi:hypothetical protein